MMTNLFSSFDPTTSPHLSLNWLVAIIILIFLPLHYWTLSSRPTMIMKKMKLFIFSELSSILANKLTSIFVALFILVLLSNALGLMPYIFTTTSHLSTTLSLALSLWAASLMFKWKSNPVHSLAHLVPTGTPKILMPLMVLIEIISITIRPLTLAIRLSANMIAGHLLITLLSNLMLMSPPHYNSLILIIQLLLISLELAVSAIQAYVITVLLTLYASEA